jgi:hypothetical protein
MEVNTSRSYHNINKKWSKKRKIRSEVRERELLKEKIKEDRSTNKMDHGQLCK